MLENKVNILTLTFMEGLRGPLLSIFVIAQEPWKLGPSIFLTFPKTKLSKCWNYTFIERGSLRGFFLNLLF